MRLSQKDGALGGGAALTTTSMNIMVDIGMELHLFRVASGSTSAPLVFKIYSNVSNPANGDSEDAAETS